MSVDPPWNSIRRLAKAERRQEAESYRKNGIGKDTFLELPKAIRKRQKRAIFSFWVVVIDLLCIAAAFMMASYIRLGVVDGKQIPQMVICLMVIYLGVSFNNKAHEFASLLDVFKSSWLASTAFIFSVASVLIIVFFMKAGDDFSRLLFGLGAILALGSLIAWRWALACIAVAHIEKFPFATLCIYDGITKSEHGRDDHIDIEAGEFGLSPDPDDPTMVERLNRIALGMDRVAVCCSPDKRVSWAFMLKLLPVASEIITPELAELHPLEIHERSGQASLVLSSGGMAWEQRLLKRTFDLAIVCAIMPVLLPTLLIVALMVKLDSRGPAFFVAGTYRPWQSQVQDIEVPVNAA